MPRKLAFTGGHQIEVVEYEDRPLEPNELRIKTEYASGKHGTPLAYMDDQHPPWQRWDKKMRLFIPTEEPPAEDRMVGSPVGTSGVGTIIELGSEVSHWQIGDRVLGFLEVSETNIICAHRPAHWSGPPNWLDGGLWELGDLDPLLALCFEPAFTAFHCIRESNVRFGDTVAVIGLGAIGLLAVRLAALSGAEQVFAVDPLPNRRHMATEFGAHHVLDPFAGDAALEIHQLTGGAGVDVAIEISGKIPALQTAIRAARSGGTVCSASAYAGQPAKDLWLGREWHNNQLTMIVPHGCSDGLKPRDFPRWDEYRAFDCIVSMMRQGRLTAPGLIQPLVSLDKFQEVWRLIQDHPEEVVKFAIRF